MAENTIKLEVVTPDRKVVSEEVEMVVAPAAEGYLGILANHAPLITSLQIGVLKYTAGGQEQKLAISGGFLEVKDNRAVVLAEAAERPEEIDVQRALAAKERAERRLAERSADIDMVRAEVALKRALNRLKVAGKIE
ncbi:MULTISPECIES: F0F1 ATP synthase subunit epsilon [unclassified Carboxydocella]|uniref:F0F1 ATP synthase subunit epsilon n=1 Tax=unclassified Carboxydocella TaxID=2685367 RepID=UPI0009AE69AD|nr:MULTISPECIES: F0F1 ATP synthase subunit epsilon [unclassified Carboxydocella]AVX29968.1 ATP synthase F1 subcomplex epsilon subunit [Carboxydocella thermautotrophica]GAW29426.1 ATP synthase epsilon chain [Carboxydocella sp. ULO1]GAW31398.1 ATP synthase epsilon chain [Carboxydocella sp. JDF658]